MRRKKRGLLSYIIIPLYFILILFGLFSVVWLRTEIVNTEYRMGRLENTMTEVFKERRALFAEKAELCSPSRLENVATQKLGLTTPEREKVFVVKRSSAPSTYKAGWDVKTDSLRKEY